jgi:hypothetical protein
VHTRDVGEAELNRFRLPVSGRFVALRSPSGAEDLLLAEAARTPSGDAALAVALAGRLARAVDGEPLHWGSLTVTDLDALVLRLRQSLIGDRIQADVACPASECGQRIDIAFSIADFLAHHTPQPDGARNSGFRLEPADEPGWFCLASVPDETGSSPAHSLDDASMEGEPTPAPPRSGTVCFRLPTADDLLAVAGGPAAGTELARRCLQPADVPAELQQHVEAAMEAIAPSLSCDLQGVCPECGAVVTVQFDPRWFCLRELRDRAIFIYQDVDLLARRYHWSEAEIVAIPHARRAAYAELARRNWGP